VCVCLLALRGRWAAGLREAGESQQTTGTDETRSTNDWSFAASERARLCPLVRRAEEQRREPTAPEARSLSPHLSLMAAAAIAQACRSSRGRCRTALFALLARTEATLFVGLAKTANQSRGRCTNERMSACDCCRRRCRSWRRSRRRSR